MKRLLCLLALLPGVAFTQIPNYTSEPPTNIPAMPSPLATIAAGTTRTLSWQPVTEWTDSTPIGAAVYYDVWQVNSAGAVKLIVQGLTATTYQLTALPAGLDCYVVVSEGTEPQGASPPYGESNASNAVCFQATAAAVFKVPFGPDNLTSPGP
jgi:hypothetical protein